MAILDTLPATSIVAGLKGSVDFYWHRGRIIARKWPHPTVPYSARNSPPSANRFKYFTKSLKYFNQGLKHLWKGAAESTDWNWHELAYKYNVGTADLTGRAQFGWTPPIEWPPVTGYTWIVRDAFYQKNVASGILNMVFEVDQWLLAQAAIQQCSVLRPELWLYEHLGLREVIRFNRGTLESCGWIMTPAGEPTIIPMATGWYEEWPPVTAFLNVRDWLPEALGKRFGVLMIRMRDSYNGPITDHTYSAGPPFWMDELADLEPEGPPSHYYLRRMTAVTSYGYTQSKGEWNDQGSQNKQNTPPNRPNWWPSTGSLRWGDPIFYGICPAWHWPKPD